MSKELEILQGLRAEAEALKFKDEQGLDACCRRTEMLARRAFGEGTKYVSDLKNINFHPMVYFGRMTEEDYRPSWNSGKAALLNLINTMVEELTLFGSPTQSTSEGKPRSPEAFMEQSVFVVHGHDEEMKQSVARALEKLGLHAIILHEQPNSGRTVIEKFMDYGQVASFAVVLLSPDDLAYGKDEQPSDARYRARQNVILELGFFLGKLGRSRVVVIHREVERFEMPSDYAGVLFVPYDQRGTWQYELLRELKAAGHAVDANALT
jgi:hypothetical protein